MARRKSARFTEKEVRDAMKMADELELDEIEEKASAFVREDSIFTWVLAGLMAATMWVIHSDLLGLTPSVGGDIGSKDAAAIGMMVLVYIVLVFRHERIRTAMTIVIAHRLKQQRQENSAEKT
jgi:hypothetical protein